MTDEYRLDLTAGQVHDRHLNVDADWAAFRAELDAKLAEHVALRERLEAAIEASLANIIVVTDAWPGRSLQCDLRVLERHGASGGPDGAYFCQQCTGQHDCCGTYLWQCPEFADLVAVHLP